MKNKQSENDVKNAVKKYLEFKGYDVYRINNAGMYNDKRKKFIFHGKKGMCDLIAVKPPVILFIETKAPGKCASPEQMALIISVNNCTKIYGLITNDFDDFEAIMKSWNL
jgi:hypothetical protein